MGHPWQICKFTSSSILRPSGLVNALKPVVKVCANTERMVSACNTNSLPEEKIECCHKNSASKNVVLGAHIAQK